MENRQCWRRFKNVWRLNLSLVGGFNKARHGCQLIKLINNNKYNKYLF